MNNLNHIRDIKTPFFLFEEEPLVRTISALRQAFTTFWNHYEIGYSVKTNSFPPLAAYLHTQNISAEVVSEDEYQLVSRVGFKSEQIICNGPIKDRSWIEEILNKNILLNIDSHRELIYVSDYARNHSQKEISVGLRINLDIEKNFPNESSNGQEGSRFGFCDRTDELKNAIQQLTMHPNIILSGLHLHITTKTRRTEIYRWQVCQFANIIHKYDLKSIKYLDIGGGFYGDILGKPNWNKYIKEISEELKAQGFSQEKLKLIVEPGVSLLAGCFSYFCKVIDIKDTNYKRFIVLDGSRIHIDPFMHKSSYFYEVIPPIAKSLSATIIEKQQLVGFTCLENDRFFQIENGETLMENDYIRFNKVGAYTLTLSPLFISYFPAVYTIKNEKIECLRSKWGINEFMQLSKI